MEFRAIRSEEWESVSKASDMVVDMHAEEDEPGPQSLKPASW